jgi:hypothetical protein
MMTVAAVGRFGTGRQVSFPGTIIDVTALDAMILCKDPEVLRI